MQEIQKNRLLPICRFVSRHRFLCRDRVFWLSVVTVGLVLQQELVWAGFFWVTTRVFWVAIELHGSMSRHGFPCVATWFFSFKL